MSTLVLVEDDTRIRDAVRLCFEGAPHRIVHECTTAAEARRFFERGSADLLLLDLGLPDRTGVDLLRELRARGLAPKAVLILTIFDDDAHVFDALRAGAAGYLLKDELMARLPSAVDEMLAGGAPMTPTIARRVLQSFHQAPMAAAEAPTARERQVLELLAAGSTYDEMARLLGISTNTVRAHIRSTYDKLHVSSKAEATREAIRRGLIPRG